VDEREKRAAFTLPVGRAPAVTRGLPAAFSAAPWRERLDDEPGPGGVRVTDSLYAQRYRLVEALPPGRALAVHRALDSQGRTVRITVVRPYDADAFQRQMGAIAAARHLDLPAVFDVGRDGLDCFVVTEDVEGTDALALVARGALPVGDATMIGAQAAAGLAALHAHDVVHGGIGPEQVVRTGDGTVKLTGAGLAAGFSPPDLRPGAPAAGTTPSNRAAANQTTLITVPVMELRCCNASTLVPRRRAILSSESPRRTT